jgi:hypothetical protein
MCNISHSSDESKPGLHPDVAVEGLHPDVAVEVQSV